MLAAVIFTGLFCLFWFCLPGEFFQVDYSTILLDRQGRLLSATIAEDEQWRFPPRLAIPVKFKKLLILFEDKRFYNHPGVDPLAVLRALWQNVRAKEVVSGASTLTMQVIRLSRKKSNRTVGEKLIEMLMAARLEFRLNKEEILGLFASYAPFGGNVVGLDAASWRYFGREPELLSWAESALLAVLPNNPGLIHPGRNREVLKQKRDRLLDCLFEEGIIDKTGCSLAKNENIPPKPKPLPMWAPHLLFQVQQHTSEQAPIRTTLDRSVQMRAVEVLERHHQHLKGSGIHNAAALILEVESGQVLAYVGNVGDFSKGSHGNQVDIIRSLRSTGSLLKPLLYAAMLEQGEILPSQLVADIPTRYSGFIPENISRTYEGAVPAYRALARSLNIPAVRMLGAFGVDRFLAYLKNLGMSTLHRPAQEYGLSLILGGAEGTLWELTSIYASLARCVCQYPANLTQAMATFHPGCYRVGHEFIPKNYMEKPLGAAACWLTLKAMVEVERPGVENAWRDFGSSQRIAWKTGTSFGLRDGWAIGVTPRYAIGVWVGNGDGEGRPGLKGSRTAAPILFDLYNMLDKGEWFRRPDLVLVPIKVCADSGYIAGEHCREFKYIDAPGAGTAIQTAPCPYCRLVHLDGSLKWRVNSSCERVSLIQTRKWFVLPPAMEWYYRKKHSDYIPLPSLREDCLYYSTSDRANSISILYPSQYSKIYIPREFESLRSKTVFKAAHRDHGTVIYWHLDSQYMGSTSDMHQMSFCPVPGEHLLTLVDERGERVQRWFTILSK